MQKVKSNIDFRRKIFLGAGKMSGIFQCTFLVLFFSYSQALSMPVYFIAPVIFLCVAVPLLLMPLIYDFINNVSLISTGRYHLSLAAISLLFAVSCSILFSIDPLWDFSTKAAVLFFSLTFTILFYLIFCSVISSISSRLAEKNSKKTELINNIFSSMGAVLFIAVFFLYKDNINLFAQTGFLCGCIILLTGLAVFLSSAPYMPKLIKLESPKHRTLVQKYDKFFSSFTIKDNFLTYIYYSLMCVSVQLPALIVIEIIDYFQADMFNLSLAASVFLICIGLTCVLKKFTGKNTALSVILLSSFCAGPLIALIICGFFTLSFAVSVSLLYLTAVFYGLGTGLFLALSERLFDEILERFITTRGTLVNIKNMLFFASFVIAFAIAAIASLFPYYLIIIVLSVSTVFLAAACVLKTAKKRYLTLDYPEGINDLGF